MIRATIRRDLTRDVAKLCALIFIADVVSGILSPTFSLFAENLGVSLALLGIITTIGGLTQLSIALPFGLLSDRIGRPRVLLGGTIGFVLCLLSLAVATGPAMLAVSRVLYGIAGVATFSFGAAHLGDITTKEQRPFAFGLYTSCMGLGFTVGPLLGAQLADITAHEPPTSAVRRWTERTGIGAEHSARLVGRSTVIERRCCGRHE